MRPIRPVPGSPGFAQAATALNGVRDWQNPAAPTVAPRQVSRVLGIGKIYEDTANPDERAKKEAELADMLSVISRDQKSECKVKFYDNLHVIVLKGTPEGVVLIEQTVAAMKENAGVKKPGGTSLAR